MKKEITRLVNKSVEAFIVSLELFNKPTLQYRVEGFSFFIVNAWELMLKAELMKRGESIYYRDNSSRTISVSDATKRIYTDVNTGIRLNLEKIIDLRNLSTHYVTDDYELKYIPLFQACVINFTNEIYRFHNVDITQHISENFLTLSSKIEPLTNEEIRLKYPAAIAEKLIQNSNDVEALSNEYNSDKFAINIKQNLYITKKHSKSDFKVSISNHSKNKVAIIKELKDPKNTHMYSFSSVIEAVRIRMKKRSLTIDYEKGFNQYVLNKIIAFYNVKENELWAYKHKIGNNTYYTYSQTFVEFIVDQIKKNQNSFVKSLSTSSK